MADILTTTRATKPGTYIGRIFRPAPTGLDGFARLPCLVGKGSRLQTLYDIPIRRSYRNGVGLIFASTAPHIATLAHTAVDDQNISTLYKEDGTPVSNLFWAFRESTTGSGIFDQVFITAEAYDPNSDYFIDYQSDSRTLQDELPFNDLREIRFIGDTEGQDKYLENVNYNVPISLSSITPGSLNAKLILREFSPPVVTGGGTPVLTPDPVTAHTSTYNRIYTLDVDTVSGGFINATVRITLGSGGNSVGAPSPFHTAATIPVNGLATGVSLTAGPTVTVTVSGLVTSPSDVGKTVVISGASNGTNNGYFTITGESGGNTLTFTNSGGVADLAYTGIVTVVRGQTVRFLQGAMSPNESLSAFLDPATNDVIRIKLDDTGSTVVTTTAITFTALARSLVEPDAVLSNTNQYPSFTAVTETVTNTSVALDVRDDFPYTGTTNRNYILVCSSVGIGLSPNRTASFQWVGYGEEATGHAVSTEGLINISEASGTTDVDLELGIHLSFSFGTVNFVVGDKFIFTAKAPRKFVTAKDSRDYTLTVFSTAANNVQFHYTTSTPEGKFGDVSVSGNGELRLPGGVHLYARNVGTLLSQNRYDADDEFTFSTINSNGIDWNLYSRTVETFNTTDIYTDTLGLSSLTGIAGGRYIILSHIPNQDGVLFVRDKATEVLFTATFNVGSPILWFTTVPTATFEVAYEYRGAEPSPGNFYYVTANIKRPAELYNTPILSLTYDEAFRLLGPASNENALLIAAELALRDNGAPGVYTCQAFDADNDLVISTADINNAIIATEGNNKLTDIVVLNGYASLSTALLSNERMNDPFERKERALWVGLPVGSQIGNTTSGDSIVATAKKTLQVYGNNPAHGTRVLLANPKAVKTITLPDGSQTDVTLDGSFIQAAIAGRNASFADPGTPLLRQFVGGFKSMQTYSESEELQLQAASVLYLSNQGSVAAPAFRIEESVTVDTSSPDNNEISVSINQRQFVTRTVRDQMDSSLIAIVPPGEGAGVSLIQGFLVGILQDLVARGIIGSYTDEAGNERGLNPATDVEVFRDNTTKTLYNFKYYWNARYPVKRLFGLYSVDAKLFSQQ